MAKKPPENGVAPERGAPEAEPTLPLDTPEAPAAPEAPAEPKVGNVRLSTQIKGDAVIDLEDDPTAPVAPAPAAPAATPAAPAKADKLKAWRLADGKVNEDKLIEDVEPYYAAGQEIIGLIQAEPEVRKAVWAAQKKRGIKLSEDQEKEIAPPPAPVKPAMTREDMHREYLRLWATPDGGPAAEELMQGWLLEQKFGPKIAEADRVAQETKARNESDAKARAENAADAALRAEFTTAAKKYDGVLAIEGTEVVWRDQTCMDTFNALAARYKAAPVEELLEWTLAKLGRLQVEPEPTGGRPTPRIASKGPAAPARKKPEAGMVSLRVSTPSLRVEDEE